MWENFTKSGTRHVFNIRIPFLTSLFGLMLELAFFAKGQSQTISALCTVTEGYRLFSFSIESPEKRKNKWYDE